MLFASKVKCLNIRIRPHCLPTSVDSVTAVCDILVLLPDPAVAVAVHLASGSVLRAIIVPVVVRF